MSVFQVELKKVVDDSYEIEIGYQLENWLIEDLKNGLVGKIKKFAEECHSLTMLRHFWRRQMHLLVEKPQ